MTTLYICRHGQTENNKFGKLSGWIDTPLTEEGIKDAESSSKKLTGITFDKIISSDLGRAFTTAYIISRNINYNDDIIRYKTLREVNYGDLANKVHSAYPKVTPIENTNFISPNGESLSQMMQRVLSSINDINLTYPDKTILLVAHDGTINAVRSSYTKQDIGVIDSQALNSHDCVVKFSIKDSEVVSLEEITS